MASRSRDSIDLDVLAISGELSVDIDVEAFELDGTEDLGTGDLEIGADVEADRGEVDGSQLARSTAVREETSRATGGRDSRAVGEAGSVRRRVEDDVVTRDLSRERLRRSDAHTSFESDGVHSAPPASAGASALVGAPSPCPSPPSSVRPEGTPSSPPPLPPASVRPAARRSAPPLPPLAARERKSVRPVAAPRARAWQSEADAEERALQVSEQWDELCSLLLLRLDGTPSVVLRARLLLRLAGVLEDRLDDGEQAFDGLVEAYKCAPDDPQILDDLERLAAKLGRFAELVAIPGETLNATSTPERIAHLANVVRWLEGPLAQPTLAAPHRAELTRIDGGHPVVLLREVASARGPIERKELLLRALERTRRDSERAAIHRALGDGETLAADAFRHFSSAVELCPNDVPTLVAFEAAAVRNGCFEDAKWAIEQLVRATHGVDRCAAKTRLGEALFEHFLRYDEAAALFREVLEEMPEAEEARTGLERCYVALRDHARLNEALGERASRATSAEERAEAFALAADLAETNAADLTLASEQWARALDAMPTHRPYLERAANVAERMGDRSLASEYRRRLVAILDDATDRARELVALAKLADDPAVRHDYAERAVAAAPSYAIAREELRAIATEGELLTSVVALRRAIAAADVPRQKARLLLRLAQACTAEGDQKAALQATEEAFRADPSNEHAAAKSLGNFIATGRHAEALAACELLLAAAVRESRFDTAQFLLRELMKVALTTGDTPRALSACVLAMTTFPKDAQPLVELVDVLRATPNLDDLDARTTTALDRLVARRGELPPGTACGLGRILSSRGDHRRAIAVVTTSLNAQGESAGSAPFEREALEVLATAYESTGELYLTATTRLRLARLCAEPDRHVHLVSAVEILYRGLGDPRAAIPPLEAALRLRGDDLALLHTAMSIYGEVREWSRLSEVVAKIGALQELPTRRAKYLAVEAKIAEEELGDKAKAARLYDEALDADKTRLADFAAVTRIYDEIADYRALERSYRRMIARVRDDGDDGLTFELFKRLSLVYSNRLGDVASARTALEAAKRIDPTDTSLKSFAVDMFVRRDELDRAVDVLRDDLRQDPYDVRSYERLLGVFSRQKKIDEAFSTAQVLSLLRASSANEGLLLRAHAPITLAEVPGCLAEDAWATHLVHPDLDPTLTEILEIMVRVSRRMGKLGDVGPSFLRTSDADSFPTLRALLLNASEVLSMSAPSLVFRKLGGQSALPPGRAPVDALLVDVDAVRWASPVLPYLAGKRLAEKRPSFVARTLFADHRALKALASAGLDIGMSHLASGGRGGPVDDKLTLPERTRLAELVEATRANGGRLDTRKWSQSVDMSTARVGLLLGQDVRMAQKVIASEPQNVDDLAPRRRIGDLYSFAVSEEYAELRRALGIHVPPTALASIGTKQGSSHRAAHA